MNDRNILVIDDDQGTCQTLTHILKEKGYSPASVNSGKEALEAAGTTQFFDVALIDLKLPDMGGIDLLGKIKELSPDTEAVIITGHASLDTAVQAMQDAAFSYVTKPIDMDYLLAIIHKAVQKEKLQVDHRNAENALKESEERYRDLYQNAPNA